MTSGQETERVYSYNPGARTGWCPKGRRFRERWCETILWAGCPSCRLCKQCQSTEGINDKIIPSTTCMHKCTRTNNQSRKLLDNKIWNISNSNCFFGNISNSSCKTLKLHFTMQAELYKCLVPVKISNSREIKKNSTSYCTIESQLSLRTRNKTITEDEITNRNQWTRYA